MHTLIHFPKQTTPATRLAASQAASVVRISTGRKRGNRSIAEMKAFIVSNAPELTEETRLEIIAMWRRGVRIAWIAKTKSLTVFQVEAVLWPHFNCAPDSNDPMAAPTVRESRTLHLVARAA